jgi:hypothetical protein
MSAVGSRLGRLGSAALSVAVALATSGCIAAGLAGGPLMSAVQMIGDRTVERTVAADLVEVQGVTETVLARMAFRIESRERDEGVRRLRAVADGVTVHARLERVTATMTRVGLRVEVGKLVADRDTGAQIHEQIAAQLTPATARPSVGDSAATEAITTLQGEVRKLRSDIAERRATERPAPDHGAAGMRVDTGAVATPPMSAALPTVGGSPPPVTVPVPAGPAPVAELSPRPAPTATPVTVDPRTAARLQPASALTPILPATGVGSSK